MPLLLTSKATNESTSCVVQEGVAEYIKNQHGSITVMLFTPHPLRWHWEDHVRQVGNVMKRINAIVEHVRDQLELVAAATEVAGVGWFGVDALTATLKMGLHLIEAIEWQRPPPSHPSSDVYVKHVLASLPPYGVLIVRAMSVLLALTCGANRDIDR